MRRYKGPHPSMNFSQVVNEVVEPTVMVSFSGEIDADSLGHPMAAAKAPGKIVDVWMSVGGSGKDDAEDLSLTADVLINGVSCLSTAPIIAHVSGEDATNKTTKETGDTGVTQAIIDPAARDYLVGDVFTCDFDITRTASPTTEMTNPIIVVELEPNV